MIPEEWPEYLTDIQAIFQGSLLKKAVHRHDGRLFFVVMSGSSTSHKYWKILKVSFYLKTDFRGMPQDIRLKFKEYFQVNFWAPENPNFERRFLAFQEEKASLEANHEGRTDHGSEAH